MRKVEIKEAEPVIDFEGSRYPAGVWLVTNGFVAEEPGCYVYHEGQERVEVKAAGVMSHETADRLLHNWPDSVFDVLEQAEAEAKAIVPAKKKRGRGKKKNG